MKYKKVDGNLHGKLVMFGCGKVGRDCYKNLMEKCGYSIGDFVHSL